MHTIMSSRRMEDLDLSQDEALQKIKQIPEAINEAIGVLKNDVDLLLHHINSREGQEEQHFNSVLQTLYNKVTSRNQQVANDLRHSYNVLNGVVEHLKEQIKTWQEHFQLFYAKLGHQTDLGGIATQCATTGFVLHELVSVSFKQWGDILEVFDSPEMKEEFKTQLQAFQNLRNIFMQSTFVVTGQEEFVIRKMKKHFPTFRLRLLAADYMYGHIGEVTPYFVSEVDLKQCVPDEVLNLEDLKKKQIKIQNVAKKQKSCERLELKSQEGTDKMECVCKNITFVEDFKRHQNKDIKVHEEKFRVVFVTKLETQIIWTMSLPLVVISASNQEVNSLASIMWQCFSTNVFSIHEEIPTAMKWSSVARMLKMKFAVISNSHNLTDSNIKHLKKQLFGVENQSDDAPVSLSLFCCGEGKRTMKNCTGSKKDSKDIPYSFWKWFLGVFNVIEDYLLPYWNDGLIMAFAGRQCLKKELLKCKESGTFILRFSDTEISDRDGVKNVHGRLKASVFCIKYPKAEESGKRKNAGPGQIEKVVEDLDLDDPPKNLANILKDERKLFYRFLHPVNKTRQELFDKYYEHKEKEEITLANFGYKKPSDVGWSLPDLEQAVKQLNILTGSSPQAIPESESDSRVIKKAKRQKENLDDLETDEGPVVTEQKEFVSQMSGNSSISPSYLEQSPEQSVPNFSFPAHNRNLNGDSVVPYSPDNNNGTAMEEEGYASGERNGTALHQTSYANRGGITSPEGECHSENEFNLSFGGASTPEAPDQPLTGNDNLISGPLTNTRSNENANEFLYGAGCQQQCGLVNLEGNTILTVPAVNELRQALTPDQYRRVLSWTQKGVGSETNFTRQSTVGEEIPSNHPGLESKEYVINSDLDFDHLLSLEGNSFGENSWSEDLQDINDFVMEDLMEEKSNEQLQSTSVCQF